MPACRVPAAHASVSAERDPIGRARPNRLRLDWSGVRSYDCGMKVKTSITLSEDVLQAVDAMCNGHGNRSEFIERALRAFIAHRRREARDARDIEIIDRNADRLNRDAADVLEYQAGA